MRQARPISPSNGAAGRRRDGDQLVGEREPPFGVRGGPSRQWCASDRASASTIGSDRSRALLQLGEVEAASPVRYAFSAASRIRSRRASEQGVDGVEGGERLALETVDTCLFERRAVLVDPDPAEAERGAANALGVAFGVGDLRIAPEVVAGLREATLLQQRVPSDRWVP